MGILEVMLERRSWGNPGKFMFYHGAGFALHNMFGDGFRPIQKGATRIRPVAVKWTLDNGIELSAAWNLRSFWDRFERIELTSAPRGANLPFELVNSVSAGVTFPIPRLGARRP